jgi:hypothetical protein
VAEQLDQRRRHVSPFPVLQLSLRARGVCCSEHNGALREGALAHRAAESRTFPRRSGVCALEGRGRARGRESRRAEVGCKALWRPPVISGENARGRFSW